MATKTWPGKASQRVVCAACRDKTNEWHFVIGPRHWDETMHKAFDRIADPNHLMKPPHEWEQGFIDQFGDFLTREEAWVIAQDNNQIIRKVGGKDGVLYSEHLY